LRRRRQKKGVERRPGATADRLCFQQLRIGTFVAFP
jgi:hypothetical protein